MAAASPPICATACGGPPADASLGHSHASPSVVRRFGHDLPRAPLGGSSWRLPIGRRRPRPGPYSVKIVLRDTPDVRGPPAYLHVQKITHQT